MDAYLNTLEKIYNEGFDHEDRTGTGRRSLFGLSLRFDMANGFPIVTTRKINYKAAFAEMFWFISGQSNIKSLHEQNIHIWDSWAVNKEYISDLLKNSGIEDDDEKNSMKESLEEHFEGQIGPMYGYVWRHAPINTNAVLPKLFTYMPDFSDIASDKLEIIKNLYEKTQPKDDEGKEVSFEDFARVINASEIDQLQNLILSLKRKPFSSRHVMTAWVPEYISIESVKPQENVLMGKGALAPCHAFIQCFVTPAKNPEEKNKLSLMLYQRSADFPVGSCFNIAQYALFLHLLAHATDMQPHEFIYNLGDAHIYHNQLELVKEQLSRKPYALPELHISTQEKDLFKIKLQDIQVQNYQHHDPIKYPVSV